MALSTSKGSFISKSLSRHVYTLLSDFSWRFHCEFRACQGRTDSSCRRPGPAMVTFGVTLWLVITVASCIEYTDIYNFPMVGLLQFKHEIKETNKSFVTYGSVTIIHEVVLIAAAENLCQLDPTGKAFIFTEGMRNNLFVTVASDLMEPPDTYLPATHDILQVNVSYVLFAQNSNFTFAMNATSMKDSAAFKKAWAKYAGPAPANFDSKDLWDMRALGYAFNSFGELQWDVAFLVIATPLPFGPLILPAPNCDWSEPLLMSYWDKMWTIVEEVENYPHRWSPCVVPGWSPTGTNEIVYHKVVYIRFKECAQAICAAYPSSCLKYLNRNQHVCFKSLSYIDSCALDQGVPVLCKWPDLRPIGILVRTWGCGTESLPSVFTRIDVVSQFGSLALGSLWDQFKPVKDDVHDPAYTMKPLD